MSRSPDKTAPHIIRMAHPLAFAAFLRHVGAPVDRHFQRVGLPALCEDPNHFAPLPKAWAFFDTAARSEDPMLGWYVGRHVGDHNLNRALLGKLEQAPTLYQALKRLVQLVSAEASHLQLGLLERENDILFYTHYPDMKGVPGYTSSQFYQFGVYLSVVRHFAGESWIPPEIGIEYPVVPAAAKKLYPGTRFLPRQPIGYMAIPRSDLPLRPPHLDEQKEGNESIVLTREFGYVETLSALLKPYIANGYPDASLAASLMDTSERTLYRRLRESGQSYRGIVDALRFSEAANRLENTEQPIIDVAANVGFDDTSHFSRMFRRVGGVSPREFRRTLR